MIIVRAPLRINFAAGGSDLPAYYRRAPGAVLGATIDQYIHVCVKPNFDGRILAHYRTTEDVAGVADLQHTRMRACLQYFGIERGIEIASLADVPGGTGLGSSGAFTAGLLLALDCYTGGHERLAHDPLALAHLAYQIEVEHCHEAVGKQDQLFAALGGARLLRFNQDETTAIEDISMANRVADHLFLIATPWQRKASAILADQSTGMEDPRQRDHAAQIVALVPAFVQALVDGEARQCAALLDAAWQHKRQIAPGITNMAIDGIYRAAIQAGAWGGKLCGAGGGGFLLFLAPPEKHTTITNALGLHHVPIRVGVPGCEVVYGP